jgi:hypothetical protein
VNRLFRALREQFFATTEELDQALADVERPAEGIRISRRDYIKLRNACLDQCETLDPNPLVAYPDGQEPEQPRQMIQRMLSHAIEEHMRTVHPRTTAELEAEMEEENDFELDDPDLVETSGFEVHEMVEDPPEPELIPAEPPEGQGAEGAPDGEAEPAPEGT